MSTSRFSLSKFTMIVSDKGQRKREREREEEKERQIEKESRDSRTLYNHLGIEWLMTNIVKEKKMYYAKERVHCSLLKLSSSITWPAFLGSSLHGPCLGYSPHPSFSGSRNTRTSSIVHPTGRFPTNRRKGPIVKTRYADPL